MGLDGTYLNITNSLSASCTMDKSYKHFPEVQEQDREHIVVLEVLATAIKKEKEIKGIQIWKEVKLSLFADEMILYTENPKDFTRKLLELINKFCKVAGYRINIQKSVAFVYTNNELSEREIKKIPFLIASKAKILRNKFNQGCKTPYLENYKALKKEIEEDTNK